MNKRQKKAALKRDNEKKEPGPWSIRRNGDIDITREGDSANVKISVSSETPVLVYREWNNNYQAVYEILDHSENSIDRSYIKDGMPLTDEHYGPQIALLRDLSVENGKLVGSPSWMHDQRSKDFQKDVEAELRRNLSVDGAVDPGSYKLEGEQDGIPVLRAMRWKPLSAAFVRVPADIEVGVNRELEQKNEEKKMGDEKKEEKVERKEPTPEVKIERSQEKAPEVSEVRAERNKEILDMVALAREHKLDNKLLDESIKRGDSLESFRGTVLEEIAKRGGENKVAREVKPTDADIGLSDKETAQFSFIRAIRSLLPNNREDAAFEREASEAVAKKIGKDPEGIFVPNEVLRRDLQIGGGGTGSNLVATDLQSGSFIELLRNKLVGVQLGVQTMTGLVGDIAVPKQSASATAYWVDEGVAPTESQQTLTQVTGTPHTCGAYTDITRKMIKQSSIDVEMFVRNDLAATIAIALDSALLNGSGASGQPTGIVNTASVGNPSVTTGTPTFEEIIGFPQTIETANAAVDAMKWAMTPEVWAKLATTQKAASTGQYLLDPKTKECIGYPYIMSNQVAANSLIFGAWSQAIIAMWGALDLTVDPYTGSSSGTVRIVALQDIDILIRHAASFAYNDAVTS